VWQPVGGLGRWLSWLLVLTVVALGFSLLVPYVSVVASVLQLVCGVLTVVWLYRARVNVEGLGGQRRGRAWVIWGWVCPVVNLWFPLQVVSDVARVDRADEGAAGAAFLRYGWWACWLLAWATGFQMARVVYVGPDGRTVERIQWSVFFGGTVVSTVFAVVAGLLFAAVVRDISVRQEKRMRASLSFDSTVSNLP
jgi:hypothetical protein